MLPLSGGVEKPGNLREGLLGLYSEGMSLWGGGSVLEHRERGCGSQRRRGPRARFGPPAGDHVDPPVPIGITLGDPAPS